MNKDNKDSPKYFYKVLVVSDVDPRITYECHIPASSIKEATTKALNIYQPKGEEGEFHVATCTRSNLQIKEI